MPSTAPFAAGINLSPTDKECRRHFKQCLTKTCCSGICISLSPVGIIQLTNVIPECTFIIRTSELSYGWLIHPNSHTEPPAFYQSLRYKNSHLLTDKWSQSQSFFSWDLLVFLFWWHLQIPLILALSLVNTLINTRFETSLWGALLLTCLPILLQPSGLFCL